MEPNLPERSVRSTLTLFLALLLPTTGVAFRPCCCTTGIEDRSDQRPLSCCDAGDRGDTDRPHTGHRCECVHLEFAAVRSEGVSVSGADIAASAPPSWLRVPYVDAVADVRTDRRQSATSGALWLEHCALLA